MRRVDYIVWGKEACPQCDTLKNMMDKKEINYNYFDVTDERHSEKLLEIKTLGFRGVPVLEYTESGVMIGFQIAFGKVMKGEIK